MKNVETLAQNLDMNTAQDYFDYMIKSHENGQFTQCRELFKAMKTKDRQRFIDYFSKGDALSMDLDDCYNFYLNLSKK